MSSSWSVGAIALFLSFVLGSASGQSPAASPANAKAVFEQYCFQCHGKTGAMAGVNLTKLTGGPFGEGFSTWQKVASVLEQNRMPPKGLPQPSEDERHGAVQWVRAELKSFANQNAGDPGRVTVRRLTSGEYGYTIQDLTGVDLELGRDSSNDSVGGEGFMNFGDVQFMQDANLERYLETAKLVADHAVIGAGPVDFFTHPGKTGFELSAITRIKDIYAANGFRSVSGEGGESFGLDKYRKAFFVAWEYQHRAALGKPNVSMAEFARQEGVSARFAQHLYSIVSRPAAGYPTSEVVARFRKLPVSDVTNAKAGCAQLEKFVTTWPSWLFARGDKAVGGAGDESPLLFTDAALKAELSHHFAYNIGARNAAQKSATPGPAKVYLVVDSVNPNDTEKPVVIWKNASVMLRKGRPPAVTPAAADGGAGANIQALKNGPTGPRIPLKDFVSAETAQKLGFGKSLDGTPVGPNDFATRGSDVFELMVPEGAFGVELQVDAAIGSNHEQVVRVTFSDRGDGPVKGIPIHARLGDPQTAGYRAFKAGVLELVAQLPPNSHGEPTPADKDPPPLPFDATYNTPEHDAFDNLVKYHRDDRFVVENMLDDATRLRLDRAWTDLYSSFDYHDGYLGLLLDHFGLKLKSKKMADLDAATVSSMPTEARGYIKPLRSEYLEMIAAEKAAQPGHLEDCLKLAGRAWRRPLTQHEQDGLRAFYRQAMLTEQDHNKAIKALLARILISPEFLYRVEQPVNTAVKALNDWEMASRLSYFLWSSIPDDELTRAARAGELGNPVQLRAQVKRMLADPKARRLSSEFFGQWLGFYRFDQYKGVDTGRFPEFTENVRTAMYDESVSFFEYIIRHDRPARELLSADYTFLNKTLAKYYGVPKEIKGEESEKVDGANAFNRGGMLRLGTVLTTTSAPLRTSPVKRGDWVLRRVLGTPTPPPPADAGSIPADDKLFGGLSLRDKLEAHKRNATCAGCHTRIDPLGFPLEHFDPTGRWREKYPDGKAIYDAGKTVDQVQLDGVNGLLDYLSKKDEQVRRTLAMKMIGYALGRTILPSDYPLIDKMVTAGGDVPFSQLVQEIVVSRQFRNRLGRDGAAVTTTLAKAGTP
jgi:mono/diheme cytochrome c family protein